MSPTQDLRNEHEGVLLALVIFEKLSSLSNPDVGNIVRLIDFFKTFVDKCHHAKEEEYLFPILRQSSVPDDLFLINILTNEHQKGRDLINAIEESVKAIRSGHNEAKKDLSKYVREYSQMLRQHIRKENDEVFVMADSKISQNMTVEIIKNYEKIESERMGPGIHESFHKLLETLKDQYLGR